MISTENERVRQLPNPGGTITHERRTDAPAFCSHSFQAAARRFRQLEFAGFDVGLWEFATNTVDRRPVYGVAHTEYQARQYFLKVYLLQATQIAADEQIARLAAELETATAGGL